MALTGVTVSGVFSGVTGCTEDSELRFGSTSLIATMSRGRGSSTLWAKPIQAAKAKAAAAPAKLNRGIQVGRDLRLLDNMAVRSLSFDKDGAGGGGASAIPWAAKLAAANAFLQSPQLNKWCSNAGVRSDSPNATSYIFSCNSLQFIVSRPQRAVPTCP